VHAPTLIKRVQDLPRSIRTVVFFDEPVPDGAIVSTIDDMLAAYEELRVDVLTQYVAATEAVKRVEGEVVAEGIDRSALVAIRCPEVIDRVALDRAVNALTDELWVNPTARVAAVGGSVAFYGGSLVPIRRR
jgi:DNA-binding FrmR family transcriptional regulator